MAKSHAGQSRWTALGHRFHARLAARSKPPTGFKSQPEPRTVGLFARGRQLIAGNLLFSGTLTEARNASIWKAVKGGPLVMDDIHACGWLDDLAAVGDVRARELAQRWVQDWIDRYGNGTGHGWTPELTGRRLIEWINHGIFLMRGSDSEDNDRFFKSLAQQTIFLSRRWRKARAGLPRFEALTGMIYAGLSLEGMGQYVDPAVRALASDCVSEIDENGGLVTRNPEELLEVFTLLNWAAFALSEAGRSVPAEVTNAKERIAPTLRALRHADGSLARFHGGGRGVDGRLDHALADSEVRTLPKPGLHMGFARLTAGRSSLVIDAEAPPSGPASVNAHASTLAFELTSGRRPLIVSCGSGRSFGADWRRAGRATPSHSTLCLAGYSSSRMYMPSDVDDFQQELLEALPRSVHCQMMELQDGERIELSHSGYQLTHGLTHGRTIDLRSNGRGLSGEDVITTLSPDDETRFAKALDATSLQGVEFTIRFHLHPDVDASLDMGGGAVSLALKSGEIWVFRHDGSSELSLLPSVYLENGRLKPRACKQVVLSGRAIAYATRVRWSLAKTQDTPDVVRDVALAEAAAKFD